MNQAESAQFHQEHSDYHRKEEAADKRAEAIDDEVTSLLAKDGECYPFRADNFAEAIENISDAKKVVMSAFFATANDYKGFNDLANHGFFTTVRFMVQEYWDAAALKIAAKNVDARML